MVRERKNPVVYGTIASLLLVMVYVSVLTVFNSWDHAVGQFRSLWYFIIPLAAGFGVQVALYVHVKNAVALLGPGATAEVATTGSVSTGSMIACCAHHATDVLPLLGLAFLAPFLVAYQTSFMVLGLASTLVGISMLLVVVQRHKLATKPWRWLMRYDMQAMKNSAIVVGILAVTTAFMLAFLSTGGSVASASSPASVAGLEPQTSTQNGITVSATPSLSSTATAFQLAFDNHQISLDFDVTRIATLTDNKGKTYSPAQWSGDPPGGHHRKGVLVFPPVDERAASFTLTLGGVDRVFIWERV